MSTTELPNSSKPVIFVTLVVQAVAIVLVIHLHYTNIWLIPLAVLASGFLADLFTGMAHFGFDYIFPDAMPILGPIAKDFRNHHTRPMLDPSNYVVNFTKDAYGSLLAALLVIILCFAWDTGDLSFLAISTLMGVCIWAFFFHQIHSYAHMGSHLGPEEFNRRVIEISRLPTKKQQIEQFGELFETVPIPTFLRILQRYRLILNPSVHNLHHISFETDFSSVNGWSDPVTNWIFAPIARNRKAARKRAEGG